MDNPSEEELQAALQAYRENIDDHGRAKAMLCALLAAAQVKAKTHVSVPDVDTLANIIRTVDGNHSLGAGRLAEEIVRALSASGGNRD